MEQVKVSKIINSCVYNEYFKDRMISFGKFDGDLLLMLKD